MNSKNLSKIILSDAKVDVKQENIKEIVVLSYKR